MHTMNEQPHLNIDRGPIPYLATLLTSSPVCPPILEDRCIILVAFELTEDVKKCSPTLSHCLNAVRIETPSITWRYSLSGDRRTNRQTSMRSFGGEAQTGAESLCLIRNTGTNRVVSTVAFQAEDQEFQSLDLRSTTPLASLHSTAVQQYTLY